MQVVEQPREFTKKSADLEYVDDNILSDSGEDTSGF